MRHKSGGNQRGKVLPNEGFLINEAIKAPELRVITHTGDNLGVVTREVALTAARDAGLDLVQIGDEKNGEFTAKIMDFGRFLYDKKKQTAEAKKKQKIIEIKEVKMRPNIGEGDYNIKLKRVEDFLDEGKHVKLTLQFRGREIPMKEVTGSKIFKKIVAHLEKNEIFGAIDVQKESIGGAMWSKIFVARKK
jgi:translation initiation factor IF-3